MPSSKLLIGLFGLMACTPRLSAENPDKWYSEGEPYNVQESMLFTEQNYDFTGETAIADLPVPGSFETWFGPDDTPVAGCADWSTHQELPANIEGIITVLPEYYIKMGGCLPDLEPGVQLDPDSDEKFYASYFIQDASGGMFVLADTRISHFVAGARVKLKVRAMKEFFELVMIGAHDTVEIDPGPYPIYYQELDTNEALEAKHDGVVVRVTGMVARPQGDFGEVYLCAGVTEAVDDNEDGILDCTADANVIEYKLGLDADLSRRGVTLEIGEIITATGPVIYSYNEHTIAILQLGQLDRSSQR